MSTTYQCIDGDMLDAICYSYYKVQGRAVEYVLAQRENAHLADRGPVYTTGTRIFLPDIPESVLRPRIERLQYSMFNVASRN